jgi:DNA-binding response OmpR family regulator
MLRGLKDNFEFKGYCVHTASDGERGLNAALQNRPDLIILDIMLPKVNGYEICQMIRKEGMEVPIIMLTAKGQESDIVLGLNIGADDYVTKPFSIRELLARSEAFLRRRRKEETRTSRFGDFELNLTSRKLFRDGEKIQLTPKEFALLSYLAKNAGKALTRDQILSAVWGYDIIVTGRSVDRCVNTLRNKIEPDPNQPTFIQTVREIGYRFDAASDSLDEC